MNLTKWWKCDLQVATPAWKFRHEQGATYRIEEAEGRRVFLDDYMAALKRAGIEIIAIADHNTGEWIDDVKASGARHGIFVFPGCEITTGSGSDGIHLIIIGGLDKTSQDFDRLVHGTLGFGQEHPPYLDEGGNRVPAASSKTLGQILDDLPEGFLAIAPHALNDNGIASRKTVQGDLRWKALHHERLVAIDPGDCSGSATEGEGFNAKLRRRELDNFPRIKNLAFVSTSDAYALSELGQRFTWLRMGGVSLEGLRQAFIDHESRVRCDWSPALADFPDRNPNNVRHAWIQQIELAGTLANSRAPLRFPLHPNLNVIIGGRGSGKSSAVAAIRQLYSSTNGLPSRLKEEADSFVETVFGGAALSASHRIQESQERQEAKWTQQTGSVTSVGGSNTRTMFPVTVISQKELFERAAGDKHDPHLSSRSLLALVDGSIGFSGQDTKTVGSFGRRMDDARTEWANLVRALVQLETDLEQLPELQQQATTLQGQVDAFSSEEVRTRLARVNNRRTERQVLEFVETRARNIFDEVEQSVGKFGGPINGAMPPEPELQAPFRDLLDTFRAISEKFIDSVQAARAIAAQQLDAVNMGRQTNAWQVDNDAAELDFAAYQAELDARGLSTKVFSRLQEELKRVRETIAALEKRQPELLPARAVAEVAWTNVESLVDQRRAARNLLLATVQERSGRLRFRSNVMSDVSPWIDAVRAMAAFRSDAYLEDVPQLAKWMWGNDKLIYDRWQLWRVALSTGDFIQLQRAAGLRPAFADRLAGLDSTLRLRLASIAPDDVVLMEFLRDEGNPGQDESWQSITQGSPGQRTAAMLAFVLHHGSEPLILDQPEDDLDSEWISKLVVDELRKSRWHRQLIVVSHNANIPVLGDAEHVVVLENREGVLGVKRTAIQDENVVSFREHIGPVENVEVRNDIQLIMEGGVAAFVRREQKYNNETRQFRSTTY